MKNTTIFTAAFTVVVALFAIPTLAAAPFKVSATTPADLAVDVTPNSDVTIIWNRAVNCTTVNTTNITISPDSWALSNCDENAGQAVFTPSGQAPATTYTVNVSTAVTDTGGTAMKNPYSMSYTTANVAASPAGYTVVAKSGGDYTDPVAAMMDLSAWCGARPCLMKIRPGVYDLGAVSLDLEWGVTVEGSGKEDTILTSTVPADGDPGTCGAVAGATVVMASGAVLRDLTVENRSSGGSPTGGVAVLFKNVSGKVDNVNIIVEGNGLRYAAVQMEGPASDIVLEQISVSAGSTGPDSDIYAINAQCGGVQYSITDSTVEAYGNWVYAINQDTGTVGDIRNATLKTSGSAESIPLYCGTLTPVSVTNSILVADDCQVGRCSTIDRCAGSVVNSVLRVIDPNANDYSIDDSISVASSQIEGPVFGSPTLVHCWNGVFAPIPDTLGPGNP